MTSTKIASPLAGIIAAAKQNLPTSTGATALAQRKLECGDVRFVLADVSSSMAERAGATRKIDVMRRALSNLPTATRIVAFSSWVEDVPPGKQVPQPSGGTALHLALEHIAAAHPTHVLVISDGHPDSEAAALAAADRLSARIDVIYCGPDNDHEGLAFMRRLARGGGAARHQSFARPAELIETTRALLLPSR